MYFRLFNFKIPKCFRIKEAMSWTYETLVDALLFLLKMFVSEFNSFNRYVKTFGFKNKREVLLVDRYKKFHKNLWVLICILQECIKDKITVNEYFKRKSKGTKYSKRWFDYTKKKMVKLLGKEDYISFREHLYKSTCKKTNQCVYPLKAKLMIRDYYFNAKETYFINKTTMWQKLINKEIFADVCDFTNMSLKTLLNILNEDQRMWPKKQPNKSKDHPFRNKPKPIGGVQIDMKVFGRKQTGIGKYVYSIECIETSSRIAWGLPLRKPDTFHAMRAIKEIIDFFESLNIKVRKIRTDNAMMFKNINFVHSNEFNEFCKKKGIVHEFTYLSEPQGNGCVEKLHLTYDQELEASLKKVKGYDDIESTFRKFFFYYNYERYLHYKELKDLPYKKQFMKPINALSFFRNYNFAK